MKRFFKLLCYSVITVFLLGIGGEKVFADSIKVVENAHWIDLYNPRWWSSVKSRKDDANVYVFCLDSEKHILVDGNKTQLVYPGTFDRQYLPNFDVNIKNIMTKAYRLGFGNLSATSNGNTTITIINKEGVSNNYTLSNTDFYGIIQAAVWKVSHGEGADGYREKYSNWIGQKDYEDIFNYLVSNNDFTYSVTLEPVSGTAGSLELDQSETNWISGEYKVNTNISGDASFTIDSLTADAKVQVKNGDNWVDATTVKNGDIIRLTKAKVTGVNNETISLTIKSESVIVGTDLDFYFPEGSNDKNNTLQNLVIPKKKVAIIKTSVTVRGSSTPHGSVRLAKVDTNGNLVKGATMILYIEGQKDTPIYRFTSKNDYVIYENLLPSSEINNKKYCLAEEKAPDGYVINNQPMCGLLEENGTLTLTVTNKLQRIRYRKVDLQGNPIEGVRLEIHDYVKEDVTKNENARYFCGVTDQNGYLTRPCAESATDSRIISPDANGTFPTTIDNVSNGIFYITETFKEGFYNPYLVDDIMDFGLEWKDDDVEDSDNLIYGLKWATRKSLDYIDFEGQVGVDEVVTVIVSNSRYVKFTKIDTGTGNEIAGAEMVLEDITVEDYSMGARADQVVASWTSDGKPYYFTQAIAGHKYRLREVVPPKDHVGLETTIEFEIDENGKVKLNSSPTQVKLSNDPNVDLNRWIIIGNDLQPEVPKTGISLINKIAVGCLSLFVGYEVIKIYRKKANS